MPKRRTDPTKKETGFVEVPFPNFYTNTISIGNNFMEFSFSFLERLDLENVTIKARAVMTPAHAKLLLRALQARVDKFEQMYGEIRIPSVEVTEDPIEHEPQP